MRREHHATHSRTHRTTVELGLDDQTEDVLVTCTGQYHLLRRLDSDVPAFVHVVLDRRLANPAMAKRTLAHVVRSLDL